MGRINICLACNAEKNGVKSRIAFVHTCGKTDRIILPLKNVPGSNTYKGNPDQSIVDAVNEMAELAYKKIKK